MPPRTPGPLQGLDPLPAFPFGQLLPIILQGSQSKSTQAYNGLPWTLNSMRPRSYHCPGLHFLV